MNSALALQVSERMPPTMVTQAMITATQLRLFKAEQERVGELQIINSIQQGLAAELDFQAIVDLVGDKLREVFGYPDLGITWLDEKNKVVDMKTVKPFAPYVSHKNKADKLVEVPINKKYDGILETFKY